MNTLGNRRIIYQAIFINPQDVKKLIEMQPDKLPNTVQNMHCTFKFQPSEKEIKDFSKLLGNDLELKVIGYCSDGKNSGFEIELSKEQDSVYTNVHNKDNGTAVPSLERTTPHITVSMIDGAKAVDTGILPFDRNGFKPFTIHGKAGFFTSRIENKEKISEVVYSPILIVNGNETKEPNILL